MTIEQIVTKTDTLRPNQYTNAQKVKWLEILDRQIWDEIVLTHERPEGLREEFTPYDEEHMTQELIAPDKYCDVYEYWLYAKMDYSNLEIDKYNHDGAMFDNMYSNLERAWNRDNMPIRKVRAINYGKRR